MWLRKNEPENFAKIRRIMLPKDYINYLLTGTHCTDYSDAAGMLLLDVKNKRWSRDMLNICGITEEQMPKLYESFEVVGNLKKDIADKFGISQNAVVVAGAGDNAAAAIGTATVSNGKCNISLGTSGTIFVSSNRFSGDEKQAIHSFCHADGGYHLMGCILSAASCNKWLCETVYETNDYAAEFERIKDESLGVGNVFFLPYLMGERSPINDTDARGVFIGMTPATKREDMLLAVMEGVSFAIKDNIEAVKSLGVNVSASTLCGGGAKSAIWRKILSSILDLRLDIPLCEEGPGYGGAILAMVADGVYGSVSEAASAITGIKSSVYPDEKLVKLYADKYEKFKKIYPAMKNLFKEIKE
jgi:xylulokinase